MPKIPIDFAYGDYEDAAPSVENRRVLNCYPETTPGKNTKTIVRGVEGYTAQGVQAGEYTGHVEFDTATAYVVLWNSGSSVHELYEVGLFSWTLIGQMPQLAPSRRYVSMATNGKNIVIVGNANTLTGNKDYYYDPNTTTLSTIESLDANYPSYGKAKDVVFKDGYYVFITPLNIFHGDNVTSGTGLAFNPLSFQNLPSESAGGAALVIANSQLYAICQNITFIYSVAPTTPFSFQRNTSFTLKVGCIGAENVVEVEEELFLLGRTGVGQTLSLIRISGSSLSVVRDQEIKDAVIGGVFKMWSYRLNGHTFVGYTVNTEIAGRDRSIVYDKTESDFRGYPVFHERGFVSSSDKNVINRVNPIVAYYSIFVSGSNNDIRALGYDHVNDETTMYYVNSDSSYNDAAFFGVPGTSTRVFEYSFPLIRDNSDPVMVNSVNVGFNGNISTAELLQSIDGITYTSLGEYDLSTISSNRAEWRRIGRFENDVSFKLRFTPISSDSPITVIDGYFLV